MQHPEYQYLDLLKKIMEEWVDKDDRTWIWVRGLFWAQMRFDLSTGKFPLLTTKKTFLRWIIVELIWLIRWETNIKYLVDRNVHIWDEWPFQNWLENSNEVDSNKYPKYSDDRYKLKEEFIEKIKSLPEDDEWVITWGDLGPVYGHQWRNFWGGTTHSKWVKDISQRQWGFPGWLEGLKKRGIKLTWVDQLQQSIEKIIHKPTDRRIIVNAWNPLQFPMMLLPPCHMFYQFEVRRGIGGQKRNEVRRGERGQKREKILNDKGLVKITKEEEEILNAKTFKIIGEAIEIQKQVGSALTERQYKKILKEKLTNLWFKVEEEKALDVCVYWKKYWNRFADLVVDNEIVIELKSTLNLNEAKKGISQLRSYLQLWEYPVGLVLNFSKSPLWKNRLNNYVIDTLQTSSEPLPTLNLQMYQRSADMFLWVPFNIASYSTMLLLIGKLTNLQPGEFIHTLGDAHIYKNHFEQVKTQLSREPKPWPELKINKDIKTLKDIENLEWEDFELVGYEPRGAIKAPVAV